jgi:crotonobetaine/carnitine-CoA ligase
MLFGQVMTDIIGLDSTAGKNPWERTLGEFLDLAAGAGPDQVFVQISGQRITYRQIQERAARAAGMFQKLGIRHGDRVCLFLTNCPEFLYCWFGLSLIGAITVPINTAYQRDETAYILNHAEGVVLVAHRSLIAVADAAVKLAPGVQHRLLVPGLSVPGIGDAPEDAGEPGIEVQDWAEFGETMARAGPIGETPSVSPFDISMLVYTSGTTGNPKGVQVTHQMYVAAGQGFAHWTRSTAADRFFTCLPYFHANAQYYSTMGAMASGATLVVSDRFSASRFWDQVREARATVVNFIGMMMPVLAKQAESPTDRDNPVRLFYGSPAFSPEFLRAFQERFGVDIIVGFGMTETCFGTIERLGLERRPRSSGLPRDYPHPAFTNEVRIVDDRGDPVPSGTPGEITVRNPVTMPGYWRNEEETRRALRHGWLFTGDLGWRDDDGFLYFVDRKKDVIRRRGENISSQEVEDVIKRHPSVLECAVLAVPSELGEDEVKAYVMPRPGDSIQPEAIVRWCAQYLAYFKVPRYIEVRREFPRTPSLRVRKDILRQEREDLIEGCFDREAAGIRLR